MAKYKITYDRENCIGCQSCVFVCPSNWEEDDDKVKPKKTEIADDELRCNKEAEDLCPIQSIKIKKVN